MGFEDPFNSNNLPRLLEIHYGKAFFCLVFLVFLLHFFHDGAQKRSFKVDEAQKAFLTLLTPSCSIWPPSYLLRVDNARNSRSKTIKLPLFQLVRYVCSGQIELRDPQNDLTDLLCDRFRAFSWSVRLKIEVSRRIAVLCWLSLSDLPTIKPVISATGESNSHYHLWQQIRMTFTELFAISGNQDARIRSASDLEQPKFLGIVSHMTDGLQSSVPDTASLIGLSLLTALDSVLDLDFVPRSHLKPLIRDVQSSLQCMASVVFEFTTVGSSVVFLSTPFILCMLPFLPRKYTRQQDGPYVHRRTSSPLLTSLHSIIELASSGPSPLIIESVKNVSSEHATNLRSTALGSENDQQQIKSLIRQFGEDTVREHRFLAAWEIALLNVGYLTRWVVAARKPA